MIRRIRRPAALPAAAVAMACALALAGCATEGSTLSEQYRAGAGENYISGDGSLIVLAPERRGEPVEFSGQTDRGELTGSADLAGRVAVLNFWYANCAPCRVEAPILEEINQSYAEQDVVFLGVNTRDSAARALSFAERFEVTYPSIIDDGDNGVQLAFAGDLAPNATPTTLVIDSEGRIAARFSGEISKPSQLAEVLDDVLAEAG